jgi:hypothetical protein
MKVIGNLLYAIHPWIAVCPPSNSSVAHLDVSLKFRHRDVVPKTQFLDAIEVQCGNPPFSFVFVRVATPIPLDSRIESNL